MNDIILLLLLVVVVSLLAVGAPLLLLVNAQEQQSKTATDGNLTATINGDNFKAGDTIVINGTVESENLRPDSYVDVIIQVYDPNNRMVENEEIEVSKLFSDFIFRFVAGEVQQLDPDDFMKDSGNYTGQVQYTPPYLYGQEEDPIERVNFTFAYIALSQRE